MSTACIKISLLLQYLRIFERGTTVNLFCKVVAVFTLLWGVAYSILGWVPCVPVYMYWSRTPKDNPRCFAYGSLVPHEFSGTYESHTAINMALDLIVLAIPVHLYFKSGVAWQTRNALAVLLFMGGV